MKKLITLILLISMLGPPKKEDNRAPVVHATQVALFDDVSLFVQF